MYVNINHHLNKQITVGNFTIDEILIVLFSFAFTRIVHTGMFETIIIVGIGFYTMIIYKEIKETKIKGFVRHFFYWLGFTKKLKTFPPSYIREFVK